MQKKLNQPPINPQSLEIIKSMLGRGSAPEENPKKVALGFIGEELERSVRLIETLVAAGEQGQAKEERRRLSELREVWLNMLGEYAPKVRYERAKI